MSRSTKVAAAVASVATLSFLAAQPALAVLSVTLDASAYSPGPGTLRGNPVPYTLGYRFNVPAAGATISGLGYMLETSSSVVVRVYAIDTTTQATTLLGTATSTAADPTVQTGGKLYPGGDSPVTDVGEYLNYHMQTLDKPIYLTPQPNIEYAMSADTAEDDNWYWVNKIYPQLVHVNSGISYLGAVDRRTTITQTPTSSFIYGTNPYFAWFNGTMDLGAQWTGAASGDWATGGNWSTVVPDGAGQSATFASATSANRNVTLSAPRTLGSMIFASVSPYTITGSGSLTLETSVPIASVSVLAGSHTVGVPVTLHNDLAVDTATSSGVNFSSGVSGAGKAVTTTGAGTVQFGNVRAGALTVAGGTVRMTQKSSPNQDAGTSTLTSLSIATGSTLDLTNNSLVLDYDGTLAAPGAVATAVRTALHEGRLTTSSDSTGSFRIGYVDNATLPSAYTTFGGQSVDGSSVLLKYTRTGDATLDGTVDFTDLLALARNYGSTGSVWSQGDTNYDSLVDFTDLLGLARNYGQGLSATEQAQVSPAFATDYALALALAPEPATLMAVALPALVALRRRRQR